LDIPHLGFLGYQIALHGELDSATKLNCITYNRSQKLNPSSRTMALSSTQPLTGMSTRNFPGYKEQSTHKTGSFTANREQIFYKMWEPQRLTNLWASTACYMNSFCNDTALKGTEFCFSIFKCALH
jgi:hypothetical protein